MGTLLGSSVGMGVPRMSGCHAVDLAGVEDASENITFTACSSGETQPCRAVGLRCSHAQWQVPS